MTSLPLITCGGIAFPAERLWIDALLWGKPGPNGLDGEGRGETSASTNASTWAGESGSGDKTGGAGSGPTQPNWRPKTPGKRRKRIDIEIMNHVKISRHKSTVKLLIGAR